MRSLLLTVSLIVLSALPAGAAELLNDFETGIEGWWTNPFGGGRITASAATDARLGQGALRADYEVVDGKLNGNLIGPFLPADAAWRTQEWGTLSLWYKTAGQQPEFTLSLSRLVGEGEVELSFSRQLPASDEWRQIRVAPRELWNRQRQRLNLAELGRIIVRSSRPSTIWIDHVTLEPVGRRLPLRPYTTAFGLTALDPSGYLVDGPARPWQVSLALPGREAVVGRFSGQGIPEVELAAEPAAEGRGTLTIIGEQTSTFTFPVLLPAPPVAIAPLGILPTPKKVVAGEGTWELPVTLSGTASGPGAAAAGDRLRRLLARDHGLTVDLQVNEDGAPRLTLGMAVPVEPPPEPRPEAYRLEVTAAGAAIAAPDARGLFNGTLTLLQMIAAASPPGRPARCPTAAILDWPDLAIRAASIPLPTSRWGYPNNATVDPRLFIEFLDRQVVARKYNTIVLLNENGVKYSDPALAPVSSPNAWTPAQLREVLDFLRANLVEPIPLINSLGHASWLLNWHKELADRMVEKDEQTGELTIVPDTHTLDPRKPGAFELLTKAYAEVIDWYQPKRLHIGLDEVRWQIDHIPADLRTPEDTIEDRAEMLGEWVNRLHEWLADRGIGMAMWTDQLTAQHNGGPPYNTAAALVQIPRDTWLFNWSSSLAPLHSYELADLGFSTVLEANSYGVHRERGMVVQGNCVGIWDKLPWLAETVGRPSEYDYQKLIHGAEYGWRLHPDLAEPKPRPDREFMLAVRDVEAVAARQPEPAAAGPPSLLAMPGDDLDAGAPPPEGIEIAGEMFPLWTGAVGPGQTVTVGRQVAALYWWQMLEADDEALTAIREGIKDPANLAGVPVATMRITFADGGTVDEPIKFGWDIRPAKPLELPAAYGAMGWAVVGETAIYLRQWVNPSPEKVIARLELVDGELPGQVILLGVSCIDVSPP